MRKHRQAATDVGVSFLIMLAAALPFVVVVFFEAPPWAYIALGVSWVAVIWLTLHVEGRRDR